MKITWVKMFVNVYSYNYDMHDNILCIYHTHAFILSDVRSIFRYMITIMCTELILLIAIYTRNFITLPASFVTYRLYFITVKHTKKHLIMYNQGRVKGRGRWAFALGASGATFTTCV